MQDLLFIEHIIPLLQHVLVFLGLAYLFTKTPVFTDLVNNTLSLPDKIVIYLVFSGFCILGTFLSEQSFESDSAIANTRAIGAVLGGLLGGPVVGFFVGLTGGVHRVLFMSSAADPIHYIDIACAVATTFEGVLAGFVHYYLSRRGRMEHLFSPKVVFIVTLVSVLGHMLIIFLFGLFFDEISKTWALIKEVAPPMLIANSAGAALIMYMIKEQKRACDTLRGSTTAWQIAEKTASIIFTRFNPETSKKITEIVQKETQVGAVAITDTKRLLAFTGLGDDHHIPGSLIVSEDTLEAINENKVIFKRDYQCRREASCGLGSVLIIPLKDGVYNQVIGTIRLYEPKNKLFRNINIKLGENIAELLSSRILAGRYERQRELRIEDQYKLLAAQVNPHFLYNALATISHITKKQPERARDLLHHLSDFFRKSLETSDDTTTLRSELEHVKSYLEIEKARFEERLQVHIDIPESLFEQVIPVFTLQPIVENAIKHGTSELLGSGIIKVSCTIDNSDMILTVEDNAGLYVKSPQNGIGLKIDDRIKIRYGQEYGVTISCEPEQWTQVNIRLPYNKE